MKMRMTTNANGTVTLSYDGEGWNCERNYESVRISREFMCPIDGGYVREWSGTRWVQVCDRLYGMGSTLSCRSRADLPDLIRREYRAMRRDEAREARKNNS